jgi:hypothetical protein
MSTEADGPCGSALSEGLGPNALTPRAWFVSGHMLSGPDGGAVWQREPNEQDRQTWRELGIDAVVTPLYGPDALAAERERCAKLLRDMWDEREASHGNRAGPYHDGWIAALDLAERRLLGLGA